MDLDELRSVQSKERTKDSLQHLRDSFYEDVAAYLAERKRQRDERAATVDNPFSDEQVRKLSDEIETAEEVVESLYERRVGKVVKLSSFAAAGAPTDTEGMTVQEAELFEDLVVRIEQNKSRVLDVLETAADVVPPETGNATAADAAASAASVADPTPPPATGGETSPSETPDPASPDPASDVDATGGAGDTGAAADADDGADADATGGVLADAMATGDEPASTDTTTADAQSEAVANAHPSSAAGSSDPVEPSHSLDDPPKEEFVPGSEPDRTGDATAESAAGSDAEAAADGTARQTVRITRDVGQILGVDEREYELASDDVVTLPTANADPLVERDAAEPIE